MSITALKTRYAEGGPRRNRIYLTGPIPSELLLDADAVDRLNWQPRVCPSPGACIASRTGDTLTLEFDQASKRAPRLRYRYQLTAAPGGRVLATLVDEAADAR